MQHSIEKNNSREAGGKTNYSSKIPVIFKNSYLLSSS